MSHAAHSVTHAISHAVHSVTHGISHLGKTIAHHPLESIGIGAAMAVGAGELGLLGSGGLSGALGIGGSSAAAGSASLSGVYSATTGGLIASGASAAGGASLLSAVGTGAKILGGVGALSSLTRKTPEINMPQPVVGSSPISQPEPSAGVVNTSLGIGAGLGDFWGQTKTNFSSKNSRIKTTRYGLGAFRGLLNA